MHRSAGFPSPSLPFRCEGSPTIVECFVHANKTRVRSLLLRRGLSFQFPTSDSMRPLSTESRMQHARCELAQRSEAPGGESRGGQQRPNAKASASACWGASFAADSRISDPETKCSSEYEPKPTMRRYGLVAEGLPNWRTGARQAAHWHGGGERGRAAGTWVVGSLCASAWKAQRLFNFWHLKRLS